MVIAHFENNKYRKIVVRRKYLSVAERLQKNVRKREIKYKLVITMEFSVIELLLGSSNVKLQHHFLMTHLHWKYEIIIFD